MSIKRLTSWIIAYQIITKGIIIPAYYFPIDKIVQSNLQQAQQNKTLPSKWNYLGFWHSNKIQALRNPPPPNKLENTLK